MEISECYLAKEHRSTVLISSVYVMGEFDNHIMTMFIVHGKVKTKEFLSEMIKNEDLMII